MAQLSDCKTTLFGAIGVQDPQVLKTGIAIKRVIDFKISPMVDDYNFEFLPVPAGFVMTGVYVHEIADDDGHLCASGTITIKTKADPTKTIGAAVTVGSTTGAKGFFKPVAAVDVYAHATSGAAADTKYTIPAQDLVFAAADMLALKGSADMKQGIFEVVVHGYLMDGDSLSGDALAVPYREGQTAADYASNKSSGDLYLKKVAAGI